MDRGKPDFASELSALERDVTAEVGDVLQVLRDRKQPAKARKSLSLTDSQPSTEAVPVEELLHRPMIRRPSSSRAPAPRPRVKHQADEVVALDNVTTRLRRDTNELLTEAALRQKLMKQSPDTRQDIVEAALGEWFERYGFRRTSQPAE